ncbi:threonine ammonia-lyase [Fusobacterium perfoetens]|uniref:threonine ammonia-lyase n=1 Tax=Fusobacterium perfoetens TaxID=852 RepID=UPI001F17867A|nr:threonine ammonia-lyase [Fusobacterium perfoetens]MCF2624837.1 threonine ammonia-lyase [Fusobacterium perfoetens]
MERVTFDMIKEAAETIKGSVKRTQIIECPTMEKLTGNKVFFKLENLQKTGSFKVRGALNKIMHLTEEEKARGVIASSAGNHAQGVALGATNLGIKSTIVMPGTAPLSKVMATRGYGAEVVQVGTVYDDAYKKACEIQAETGATFLHPFDDPYVIAGQGTIGMEIIEDLENVDMVIVPIGGGGIASGIAKAVKSLKPSVKMVGVEAENAASMLEAVKQGCPCTIKTTPTIADGIAVARAGELTCEMIRDYVDEIVTVSEDDIARAILFLMEKGKVVAEGAGATPVAALLAGKIKEQGQNICCVISGGNSDINMIERIINKALILEGRKAEFNVVVPDRAGELFKVLQVLADKKANILRINQSMYKTGIKINNQVAKIVIECANAEHRNEIAVAIREAGFELRP